MCVPEKCPFLWIGEILRTKIILVFFGFFNKNDVLILAVFEMIRWKLFTIDRKLKSIVSDFTNLVFRLSDLTIDTKDKIFKWLNGWHWPGFSGRFQKLSLHACMIYIVPYFIFQGPHSWQGPPKALPGFCRIEKSSMPLIWPSLWWPCLSKISCGSPVFYSSGFAINSKDHFT